MENILRVAHLNKTYKGSGFRLRDITFDLPSGTIMGLVGENGSGKTTTISTILNTLRKDSGVVEIFGHEMTDENTAMREDIGVVFDASNFSPNLTPLKLGKVMADVYKQWDDAVYSSYLQKFSLPPKQQIKNFSRGMTMKLAIASALAHQPKLLILDEATSGLDPIVRDEVLDVFLDFVQDETHGILLSSHITTDLEKVADYITFIHNGQIILSTAKDTLRYNYGIMRCNSAQFEQVAPFDMVAYRKLDYQVDVLVSAKEEAARKYRDVVIDNATIEEIMLMLVKGVRI